MNYALKLERIRAVFHEFFFFLNRFMFIYLYYFFHSLRPILHDPAWLTHGQYSMLGNAHKPL